MTAGPESSPRAVRLASLQGSSPSAELLADLRAIAALPIDARRRFWDVLGPCLNESLPRDLDERVEQFCKAHDVKPGPLGDAVSAARALIRGAVAANLSGMELAEDLEKLPGGDHLAAILGPGYDAAKAAVRTEIARGTLTDHGNLLDGVDWRIESILASNRGRKLDLAVASLTLRYRKGERRRRLTLQVTRETLSELHEACSRLLAEPSSNE